MKRLKMDDPKFRISGRVFRYWPVDIHFLFLCHCHIRVSIMGVHKIKVFENIRKSSICIDVLIKILCQGTIAQTLIHQ